MELIVRMYERGQQDAETFFAFCDPQIEWDISRLMPDGRIYRGHAGVREFWRGWAGTWDDFSSELTGSPASLVRMVSAARLARVFEIVGALMCR